MPKVNYYLKNAPSSKFLEKLRKEKDKSYNEIISEKRPIVLSVAFNGNRHLLTTGKFISLKLWDKRVKRIKHTVDATDEVIADRDWLDDKKIKLERYLKTAIQEGREIDKSDLKNVIFAEGKSKSKENLTLQDIFEDFIRNHKNNDGASLKENTKKKYNTLCKHLEKYQGNNVFNPCVYTTEWVFDFKAFLLKELQLIDNSVSKYVKGLKTLFKYLKQKNYDIKADLHAIKTPENEQIVVALNESELKKLENIELENDFQKIIRDIFLFQCYTGPRYSDIYNIKHVDINCSTEIPIWRYISIKTGMELTAPLFNLAINILNKYKDRDEPLPKYSNQYLNREIKKIAKIAQLDRQVKQICKIDGLLIEKIYTLHERISSHFARRTFITLSLEKGVNERKVRAITGHKDERSFRRYVDLSTSPLVEVKNAWDRL